MVITIEQLSFEELSAFLRKQADDAFPELKDEEKLDMLAKKWSSNAECCTCRGIDGSLKGIVVFYANGIGSDFAYIPHVYVSPSHQRKGLFTRMFEVVVGYVKLKGVSEIRLEVGNDNQRAEMAYLKNGFIKGQPASPKSVFMYKFL